MMNKQIIVATEKQWRQQAEAARQEAELLSFGKRREVLVREARRLLSSEANAANLMSRSPSVGNFWQVSLLLSF